MTPFKIMMLGVGNGFSKDTYNNNALIEVGGSHFLIDCGVTAWHSLNDLGYSFNDIAGIFITHLHYDHTGGLQEAALYGAYAANQKMKLYIPVPLKETLWENELKGALYNRPGSKTSLEDYFDVVLIENEEPFTLADLQVYWIQTEHVPEKFSCSLVMDHRFFYTSDMVANKNLLMKLYEEGIRTFYHDMQFKNAVVHASFEDVCHYPKVIKDNLFAMHYGELNVSEEYLDSGIKFLKQHEWKKW